jgi:NAD-dependent SIR2 family protein deacetylase
MLAHEYNDEPEVLRAKAKLLADLVRQSKNCLIYSGAGISTSSGIDDYATRADQTVAARPKIKSPWDARPTRSHYVLTQMYQAGHLKYWVQQNHDGLPQKAGFPQHAMNEIHGAWYDPSNPVVKMNGSLRGDLFADLLEWENKTDLVLTLGTSLAGMNADRVVHTVSGKARKKSFLGKPKALGSVIVGLQQTPYDEESSLRVYSRLDEFMLLVAEELSLTLPPAEYQYTPEVDSKMLNSDIFTIPYDAEGKLDETATTILDLREGQKVVITEGPYKGAEGKVMGKNREGHYKITCMVTVKGRFKAPWPMVLGSWWVEAAVKGSIPLIPVAPLLEK